MKMEICQTDYEKLMKSNSRLRGSLAAKDNDHAEFRAWSKRKNMANQFVEYKTQHAKTRLYKDVVRVIIEADRNDANLVEIIESEGQNAVNLLRAEGQKATH